MRSNSADPEATILRERNMEAGLSVTGVNEALLSSFVILNKSRIVPASSQPPSCARVNLINLEPLGAKSEAVLGGKVLLDLEVMYELV